jgi:endonuclease/exonuclease/phosphatase family metal-dependent hydrolase
MLAAIAVLIVAGCCFALEAGAADDATLTIMTFNIRGDTSEDGSKSKDQGNAWVYRKDMAARFFLDQAVDLAGLQEVNQNQSDDLAKRLPQYARIGGGGTGKSPYANYVPIFYRKDKFTVLEHHDFWLSETPDQKSKGWDSSYPRMATWAMLRRNSDGQRIFFMNTHLDHQGKAARIEGVRLLASQITRLSQGAPVILTGDFNSELDSEAVSYLRYPVKYSENLRLSLARDVSKDPDFGSPGTVTGFSASHRASTIDYIFVSREFLVKNYKQIQVLKNGVFISDHWPVVSHMAINKDKTGDRNAGR